MAEAQKKTINLQIKEDAKCGVYANVMAVTMNPNEVILDFAYRLPGTGDQVQIVSRVNLSHQTAKQVISTLQNSLLDFENRKKK